MKIERKIRLMDAAVLAVGSFALWLIVPWMGFAGWVLAAALALKALLNIPDTAPELNNIKEPRENAGVAQASDDEDAFVHSYHSDLFRALRNDSSD